MLSFQYPAQSISVGLTTFNRWDYTQKTLEALVSCTPPETEIIIVDNGSTDESIPKLRAFVSALRHLGFQRVQLIENPINAGVGCAINQAFSMSSGSLLVKLDNDLLVPPNWLYYLWKVYDIFKDNFGVCCLEVRDSNGTPGVPTSFSKGVVKKISEDLLFEFTGVVNGATMTVRKSFWEQNPFYEGRFYGHEDALMVRRALQENLVCGQLRSPETGVIHLQEDNLYWGYDYWKAHVAITHGATPNYKHDTFCIPVKGKKIIEVKYPKKS